MNTQRTSIGTALSGKSIMLERRNGNPFLSLQEKVPAVKYDFSRSEEKKAIITRMEQIIGSEMSAYNDMPEYLKLKEQLVLILESEKTAA